MRPDAPEHLPRRCTPGWSRLPHTRALDHARPAVPDRHSHVLALLHAPTRAARRARRRLAWASRHAVDLDAGSPSNSHASPGAAFRAPSASTAPAEQSAAADQRHLGAHYRHELHVRPERQAGHIEDRTGDVVKLDPRLGADRAVGCSAATARPSVISVAAFPMSIW